MAGLLDDFSEFIKTPGGQGLLSAAFGGLAGARRGAPLNSLGNAGLAGLSGYSGALDREQRAAESAQMGKYRDMQQQTLQMQLEAAKKKAAQDEAFYAGIGKFINPGQAALPPLMGDESTGILPSAGRAATAPSIDQQGMGLFMAQNGRLEDGLKLLQPKQSKFSTAPQYDQNGRAFILAEDGSMKYLDGIKARDKLVETDLGGTKGFRTEFSPSLVGELPKTQSPDSKALNQVAWANYGLSKDRLNFDKAGGADGAKPQLVDGQFVYKPDAQNPNGRAVPIAGFQKQLGEGAKKQLSGVEALNGSISEYLKEMKGWDMKAFADLDKRAAMGTKYNNMMLQAKEAYNLGVLNGPDYQILQSVVTDPTSIKGAFISNKALTDQAKELSRMMSQSTAPAVRDSGKKAESTDVNSQSTAFSDPAKESRYQEWKRRNAK